ncbi:DUF1775 domain-containing protein [Kitasatospora sp. NPDC049258]|uniref:DUF1775 domain-containing protein n=1 Tax=Kitasatospora sp. NPDC049258 TaxID=3155394 RepID=UPI00342180C7
MPRSRLLARAAVPAAALVGALALAGPAFAHVEVESSTPQALAADAVIAFDAEGESSSAGIKEVRVVLPEGLQPGDVSLVKGPEGWTLSPIADGYAVAGPALAPGADAQYSIKVRQLPDAPELAFKSLVGYTDGQIDRWIELPQGAAKPAHPAPVLKLTAAAPGAKPLTPSPTAAASEPAAAQPSAGTPGATASPDATASPTAGTGRPAAAPAEQADGSSGVRTALAVAAAVLLVAAGGFWVWRRRSTQG